MNKMLDHQFPESDYCSSHTAICHCLSSTIPSAPIGRLQACNMRLIIPDKDRSVSGSSYLHKKSRNFPFKMLVYV